MKPLTTQQEVLLSSDDRDDEITGQVNKVEQGNGKMEGQIDISRDNSSPESDNTHGDHRIVDDSDLGSQLVYDSTKNTPNGIDDATKHISAQEDLSHESALDDKLVVPSEGPVAVPLESENTVDSYNAYGFRVFDSNAAVDTAESTAYLKENLFNVEPGNVSNHDAQPLHLNNEQADGITSSSGSINSSISKTSSSLGADNNETETVSIVVNPESNNTISDPKFLTEDDQENILSALKKENLDDLNKIPQISYEGNKSPFEEQSNPGNDFPRKSLFSSTNSVDEEVRNDNSKVNGVRSQSPNSGSLFSAPGIPAPTVVSAAVQVLPGKVLVPAAVDQVQGQALAALQVLKVIISSHSYVSRYKIRKFTMSVLI